jgi:exodeoxyribonuclease X
MKDKILYFDTETTDIQTKDIIQLAIMKEDGNILNMYFKPIQDISYAAMAVHHLTPEFLKKYKPFEDAKLTEDFKDEEYDGTDLKGYLEYLSKEYVWVAHNMEFDAEVLRRKGISIQKQICTFKLARNMLTDGTMDLESYSLQYLRYYLGLYKSENGEHNVAHDALSDVYFLRDLFKYIQKNSSFSLEHMIQVSKEPPIIRNINFGKHAGRSLIDISKEDRGYLEWLMENTTDREDLRWNIERVLSIGNGTLFD